MTESKMDASKVPSEVGDYILEKQIGHGAFSLVYKGIKKSTNEVVAIKVIDVANSEPSKLEGEINILKEVDHPFIISLIDVLNVNDGNIYIVTDLVEGGELLIELQKILSLKKKKQKL